MEKLIAPLTAVLVLTLLPIACSLPSPGVVEEEAPAELRFLTQNTMLLPSYADAIQERVPCINHLIEEYDVVGLQEVFDDDSQNGILKAWHDALPGKQEWHSLDDTDDIDDLAEEEKPRWGIKVIDARPNSDVEAELVCGPYYVMGPDQGGLDTDQDGGLVILSKYPIVAASAFVFQDSGGWDAWANKGALYARIRVGSLPEQYIHVFNTHLQAHNSTLDQEIREKQIVELREFIKKAIGDGQSRSHPIVVLGDFNIIADDSEYGKLQSNLLQFGANPPLIDLWPPMKPSSQPDYTWIGTPDEPIENGRHHLGFSISQGGDGDTLYDKVACCAEDAEGEDCACHWDSNDTNKLLEELRKIGLKELEENDIGLCRAKDTKISFASEPGGYQTAYVKSCGVEIERLVLRCECPYESKPCVLRVYRDAFTTTDKNGPYGVLGNVWSKENDKNQRIDYVFFNGGGAWLLLEPKLISLVPSSSSPQDPYYCFDGTSEECTVVTSGIAGSECRLKSYTVSDHLGVEMVAELEYQQISSTSTQTSMPTVKPTATPWPTMAPPQPATFYVGFNNDRSPFDDRRVRQAFAMAIDRQALLDEIGWDSRLPATTFVPPEIWPDGRDLYGEVGLTFDPAKARALLDEAGRPSVVTVGYSAIDDDSDSLVRALVELLAVQWEGHLGVEINTLPIEREVYIGQLEMDAPQAYLLGWRADYDSPYNFLADVFRSDSPNNYAHYHNPAYDALLEEAILETDESTQLDMYMEAEWILCEDDAAIAPLYHYISYPDEP